MSEKFSKYLAEKYFTPSSPASYSGVEKLWFHVRNDPKRPAGINRKSVSDWLKSQQSHRVFSAPRKPYKYDSIIVEYPFQIWESDIVFVDFPKANRGYRYLICFIDIFSRYLWVRPLKKKTGQDSALALRSVFEEAGSACETLRSDEGSEYISKSFQQALLDFGVNHSIARGPNKANFVERVQKTLEQKLYKYFYENQTHNFVDVIQQIVKSYNTTVHSTTGVRPIDVDEKNFYEIYERLYLPILNERAKERKIYSLDIGNLVQILLKRDKFTRSYNQAFTEELFKVTGIIRSSPPRYKVEDLLGTPVKGSFYGYQLLKFRTDDRDKITFKIEKVISTKKRGRQKFSLVKWLGYDSRHNSLIPTSQVKDYTSDNKPEKKKRRKTRK